MLEVRRWSSADGPSRRWWYGEGSGVPEGAERLLAHARGRTCRWERAGRAAGPGIDQVTAEHLLWTLVDAGLVSIAERRNRAGDWEPYRWRLTPAGEARGEPREEAPDLAAYLAGSDEPGHPVLQSIRSWLGREQASSRPLIARLAMAIGRELREGRVPRGRLIAVEVGGHTKALRVEDYRDELEEVLGFPVEDVVRLHGRAVYLFGPLSFQVGAHRIDGTWSVPWLALTPETIGTMEGLEVRADRLLTIENLVAFEEEVRSGLPKGTVALYTGGFPGSLERQVMRALIGAGIRYVDHWGDLDLGGLRILRHLQAILPVPVHPFRMEVELLSRLPTRALTEGDRVGLRAWLEDGEAPGQALARAMLELDRKAEQEGWFMVNAGERVGRSAIPSILDVLADAPGHLCFHTGEEVDAHLKEEQETGEQ